MGGTWGTPTMTGWGTPSRPGMGTISAQTWNGVPPLSRPGMGYHPCPDLGWGTPHPDLEWGTPTWDGVPPTWDGVPPNLVWGIPPELRWGTPPDLVWVTLQTWDGVPPATQTWDGVPPQQVWTDTQTRVKTLPSLILHMWVVKMWRDYPPAKHVRYSEWRLEGSAQDCSRRCKDDSPFSYQPKFKAVRTMVAFLVRASYLLMTVLMNKCCKIFFRLKLKMNEKWEATSGSRGAPGAQASPDPQIWRPQL